MKSISTKSGTADSLIASSWTTKSSSKHLLSRELLGASAPRRSLLAICLVAGSALFATLAPQAFAADPALGSAIEVKVQTGALPDKMFQFIPSTIEFKAGTLYKLVLNNPGPNRHSFSSKQFAASVKTLKVRTTAKGVVTEGEGANAATPDLQVIELPAQTQVEWWLIPQKSAEFTDLHCTVPGHEETGMGGTIVVK